MPELGNLPGLNRDFVIHRLLDWADEARGKRRLARAEHLVELAWEAYDQGCARGPMGFTPDIG